MKFAPHGSRAKRMLQGLVLGAVAGYFFGLVLLLTDVFIEKGLSSDLFSLEGLLGLVIVPGFYFIFGAWIALPIGVLLALLIPAIVKGRSENLAVVLGAGVGGIAGLVGWLAFPLVFTGGRAPFPLGMIVPYCALWGAGYAVWVTTRQTSTA